MRMQRLLRFLHNCLKITKMTECVAHGSNSRFHSSNNPPGSRTLSGKVTKTRCRTCRIKCGRIRSSISLNNKTNSINPSTSLVAVMAGGMVAVVVATGGNSKGRFKAAVWLDF